jgi:two-component system nitrate/nitrite response regulator NarL
MVDERLRVLVVDDEPDVMLLLQVQLDVRDDVEVVGTATDGAEAIEKCRDLRPDAVVMDLLMPGVSGFDAIEAIRVDMPDVGIVAHTAAGSGHVRDEVDRLGIPLVLKSGAVEPLISALRASAGRG